jgi:hypothetical protein
MPPNVEIMNHKFMTYDFLNYIDISSFENFAIPSCAVDLPWRGQNMLKAPAYIIIPLHVAHAACKTSQYAGEPSRL